MKFGNLLRRRRDEYINGQPIVGRWGRYTITVKIDAKPAPIPRGEETLDVAERAA